MYELRSIDPKLSIPGDNDDHDNLILVACANLTGMTLDEPLKRLAGANGDTIKALTEAPPKHENVRRALIDVHLAKAYLYKIWKHPDVVDTALNDARTLSPDVQALTAGNAPAVRRRIRRQLRRLHRDISDRFAFRIRLTLGDIGGLLALWSVLFLVSGYLYTSTLLHALGVDASALLSIGDYVSASVDQIRYAGFATAWGLLIYFYGAFNGSRKSRAQVRSEAPVRERMRILLLVLITFETIAGAWFYFDDNVEFIAYARNAGILASLLVADWLANRMFEKSAYTAPLLAAIFTFLVHIGTAVSAQIYKIEHGTWSPVMKAKIILRGPPAAAAHENYEVILGSSEFVVVLDRATRKIIAIPRDRIEQIEIERPK